MAIRRSKSECFEMRGSVDEVLSEVEEALYRGKFSNIRVNHTISQVTADYHKMSVYGDIVVTVTTKTDSISTVTAVSTANTDNIYAAFSSPNSKILDKFKSNL